jgi:hypothetical protein
MVTTTHVGIEDLIHTDSVIYRHDPRKSYRDTYMNAGRLRVRTWIIRIIRRIGRCLPRSPWLLNGNPVQNDDEICVRIKSPV